MMTSLPIALGVIVCLVAVLLVVGAAGFALLVKAGVIVHHAVKPGIEDRGSYTLGQGREVRPEAEPQENQR